MSIIESLRQHLPDRFQQQKKKKKRFNFQNALTELAEQKNSEIFEESVAVVEVNPREKMFRELYQILEDLRNSRFFVNNVVIAIYPLNLGFSKDNEVSVHFTTGQVFIKLEYIEKNNKIILRAGEEASYIFDKFPLKKEFKVDKNSLWITKVQMAIVDTLAEEKYKPKEFRFFSRENQRN